MGSQRIKHGLATATDTTCLYKKTKVRAYGSITSWQIEGEIVEAVADFISGGSRITADGDCRN